MHHDVYSTGQVAPFHRVRITQVTIEYPDGHEEPTVLLFNSIMGNYTSKTMFERSMQLLSWEGAGAE